MPGSVSGGGEQYETSIAEDIVVAVDELYQMLLVKGDCVLPASSPFILDFLHQHERVGKHFDVPRVVRVAMRHGHQFDVRRLNVYLFELRRDCDRFAPDRAGAWSPFMKHLLVIRQLRYSVINAGVPQKPSLAVVDEVAVPGKADGDSDIPGAGRTCLRNDQVLPGVMGKTPLELGAHKTKPRARGGASRGG